LSNTPAAGNVLAKVEREYEAYQKELAVRQPGQEAQAETEATPPARSNGNRRLWKWKKTKKPCWPSAIWPGAGYGMVLQGDCAHRGKAGSGPGNSEIGRAHGTTYRRMGMISPNIA
jgi:hypothetical protein